MRIIATILLSIVAFSLSACGTMKGFGQDVKTAGQKIENAASK